MFATASAFSNGSVGLRISRPQPADLLLELNSGTVQGHRSVGEYLTKTQYFARPPAHEKSEAAAAARQAWSP